MNNPEGEAIVIKNIVFADALKFEFGVDINDCQ